MRLKFSRSNCSSVVSGGTEALRVWPLTVIVTSVTPQAPFASPLHAPGQCVADFLRRRVEIVVEQSLGRHQHAGAAEAALQRTGVLKGRLNRVQPVAASKALDGENFAAVGLTGEHQAGIHRLAVDDHRAGATVADVAAELGAG